MVTERDVAVLLALSRYHVLSRAQVQRLCFPGDVSGRVARRRLDALVHARLIGKQQVLYCRPGGGNPGNVYFPTALGGELLAAQFNDERYLGGSTLGPVPHHIPHWLAVSETHITLDAAVGRDSEAKIEGWVNEYDLAEPSAERPERKFRLYTLIEDHPRLVCAPDAAFLLSVQGHTKVFYLEQDRATTAAREVAAGKTKGYAALAERGLHRRHFPDATVNSFTVLMVAPTAGRREILRKAVKGRPGDSLWRFAAAGDLTPEKVLRAPIFYPCDGEPTSLLRRKEEA
jgi:hypothetical protein